MTSALVRTSGEPREMAAFNPHYIETVEKVAEKLAKSGMFPNRNKDQLAVIIMQGHELGLGTMQAVNGLYVIGGRAALRAELAVSLVLNSGKAEWFFIHPDSSPTSVTAVTKRVNAPKEITLTWTMQDAQAAGLMSNQNYKKYPQRMLEARAMMALARQVYPDVLMGLYAKEELEDSAEEPVVRARIEEQPTASTGGVSLLSPPADVPSRAASSGPSNGGAPLLPPIPEDVRARTIVPTPTAEVKAAIEAAFPGAEVGEPRYADDFLRAEFKRFATDFGKEWCQGFGTTKGLDAEGRAKLYERMKAEAQRLDTLSIDEWKLYAVELDKVKVGLAEEVWSSVMPEKVASIEEAHVVQIDRLYKAADKALGDVPL